MRVENPCFPHTYGDALLVDMSIPLQETSLVRECDGLLPGSAASKSGGMNWETHMRLMPPKNQIALQFLQDGWSRHTDTSNSTRGPVSHHMLAVQPWGTVPVRVQQ